MMGPREKRSLPRQLLGCLTLAILTLAVTACDNSQEDARVVMDSDGRIEGTVIYRERMMLPPEARIEVQFEDISQPDAMAAVLATVQVVPSGGPPYAFAIDYDPQRIDTRRRYALRASIAVGDSLMFTSTDYIDPFSGNPVEILVRRVAEPVQTSGDSWGNSTAPAGEASPD